MKISVSASILAAGEGSFHEAEIEHLASGDFFRDSRALLGKINGAVFPLILQIAKSAEYLQAFSATCWLMLDNFGPPNLEET